MSFLKGLGKLTKPAKIRVELNDSTNEDNTKRSIIVNEEHDQFKKGKGKKPEPMKIFGRSDVIKGKVIVEPEKKFDYNSIKIELIGETVTYYDSKSTEHFLTMQRELKDQPGTIDKKTEFEFEFKAEKEYESYRGINCDLRYYMKVTIARKMFNITHQQEFWVQQIVEPPERLIDDGIHMEVGLEGIVMLSINYDNVWLDVKNGVIVGILKFFLVKAKIDKCEVTIKRKEKTGRNDNYEEEEILKKFEIIDGTPAKDEVVPVRFYLNSIDNWRLTPSDSKIAKKFKIEYLLHLALCDTKGRRFFKQKTIHFYRSSEKKNKK